MVSLGRVAKLQVGVFHSALSCASIKATGGYISQIQSRLRLQWGPHKAAFCSTRAPSCDITVQYKHGRPVLAIPLPSRRERCLFSLRPMLMNVGDFIQDVQREDPGVTTTAVLSEDGERLSSCTSVETLLRRDFRILINNVTYHVHSPARAEGMPTEQLTNLEDLKAMVHTLHTALQLPRHHQLQERELLEKLDSLRQHLVPLEKVKSQVEQRAESMCSWGVWAGLAVLSLQGGVLAWFTWWVYSWDIMEPITYFLTYATSLGFLSYFILTKQEFAYAEAKDRKFLHYFYKAARRQGFDVNEYNKLKEEVAGVEDNLRRLRKQIQLRLPLEQIQTKP
ncbi:calcium uniporter regulatory subunit MCUb, mitochondrial-like isoform X1 [Anguilla anguilla]|uniref:calcium uniporter regulatory subunit MCUb, mitochondrial-like isoform X1 n=1 Tax=Anguilla anguilla TaxID=7936 RepID=UPI0015ADF4AF|nr:calcium uniporter regulatory subunit MCUb, mitochondrial-like isoform X1 [Anguilla anguilla]